MNNSNIIMLIIYGKSLSILSMTSSLISSRDYSTLSLIGIGESNYIALKHTINIHVLYTATLIINTCSIMVSHRGCIFSALTIVDSALSTLDSALSN